MRNHKIRTLTMTKARIGSRVIYVTEFECDVEIEEELRS